MPATQKDVASMKDLLTSGVHFGHQTRRWNPKMKPYIFGERGGIYIIDLQKASTLLDEAYAFLKRTAERGGSVLFVGTKKQCQESIVEQADRVGMPYVSNRWLGGLLTNYSTLSKRIKRMHELRQLQEDGSIDLLPTREAMKLRGDLRKLEQNLGGVKNMDRLPAAVFVVDPRKEQIVVKEARKLNIPIVALVDTNCDPDEVDYVIPGNDDAIRSCGLIVRVIADAVAEGRQLLTEAELKAEAERKAAEEAAIAEAVAAAEAAAAEAAAAEAKAAEEALKAQDVKEAAEKAPVVTDEASAAAAAGTTPQEPAAAKPDLPRKTDAPRADHRAKAEAKPEIKAGERPKKAEPEAKAEAEAEKPAKPKAEKPAKADESKVAAPKAEEVKAEKPAKRVEEVKAEEPKAEKPKAVQAKPDEPKAEKAKPEKAEEPKAEKAKAVQPKADDAKAERAKAEKPAKAKAEKPDETAGDTELKPETPATDEPQSDAAEEVAPAKE